MSQRAIKQKKDEVSFLFFFFFASFSWPYFSTAGLSVYLKPVYNYYFFKFTPALLSTVEQNPGAFNPLVVFIWVGLNSLRPLVQTKQPNSDLLETGSLGPLAGKLWSRIYAISTNHRECSI